MYETPKFLTKRVLSKILSEFDWPFNYKIGDDSDSSEGIEVTFPKCTLVFIEGFDSEIIIEFRDSELGITNNNLGSLTIAHAIQVISPKYLANPGFTEPKLTGYNNPFASLEKVQNDLRDNFILIQTYLMSCIEGDFSWAKKYQ